LSSSTLTRANLAYANLSNASLGVTGNPPTVSRRE
jgi:uncharacterized protein YjbI with pentapeptide repeats